MSDACAPTVYGPCAPYATLEDVTGCGGCHGMELAPEPPPEDPTADQLLMERALVWASRRVFEATGGQWWGCCPITVRPCRPSECTWPAGWPAGAFPPPGYGPVPVEPWQHLPAIPFGMAVGAGETVFVNVWRCGCTEPNTCSCGAIGDRLVLPFGPVREVLEVKIDGVVLEADEHYAVTPEGVLVRTDGELWPRCQDVTAAPDAEGTWSVTYRHGFDPPPELRPMVAEFACELARACQPGECSLPPGFQVVNRDGVDFGVVEPSEYRAQGLTGFGPIDDWILLMRGGHVGIQDAPRAYRPRFEEIY